MHRFVQYDVKDYPTFLNHNGKINEHEPDHSLYVGLDTGAGYADRRKLAMNMVYPFELKGTPTKVYTNFLCHV